MYKKLHICFVLLIIFGLINASQVSALPPASCRATQINQADAQSFMPDPSCTPGVIDPAVTQENLDQTICVKGYTKKIRPPVSYTNALKQRQIVEYGYIDANLQNYEEDHLISLELGGSPRDPKNLWPEPHASINEKDVVENYLHAQVCSGRMSLAQAQQLVVHNWYQIYIQTHPPSLKEEVVTFFSQFMAWVRSLLT